MGNFVGKFVYEVHRGRMETVFNLPWETITPYGRDIGCAISFNKNLTLQRERMIEADLEGSFPINNFSRRKTANWKI